MTAASLRLWDKGEPVDELMHRFTVGDDPMWDRHLVHWDCLGSAAHACTLVRAGLLTTDECQALLVGLAEVEVLDRAGRFELSPALEDCHTAIEVFLTQKCGPVGEKIHAARSRNDQVATAMRLFLRHHALRWLDSLGEFVAACADRIEQDGDVPMPGYTHMRPAMPSSVGQWLHAPAEAALEQMRAALDLLDRLDACPLGTGAGFGLPVALDRAYAAKLLGFARAPAQPAGRAEQPWPDGEILRACRRQRGRDPGKAGLGSNPVFDGGIRVFRAAQRDDDWLVDHAAEAEPGCAGIAARRSARLRARVAELESVCGKLPSSYHRDLQLTKEPAIRTALEVTGLLAVATRVVAGFTLQPERLAAAMRPELYATHAALILAQAGYPFARPIDVWPRSCARGGSTLTALAQRASRPESSNPACWLRCGTTSSY